MQYDSSAPTIAGTIADTLAAVAIASQCDSSVCTIADTVGAIAIASFAAATIASLAKSSGSDQPLVAPWQAKQ